MDSASWDRLEQFWDELTGMPAAQRLGHVDRLCVGDPALRDELLSLLAAHDEANTLLDLPPAVGETAAADATLQPLPDGTRIGVWRIGALIGRGGAGEVYAATRADGNFEQSVVLKRLYREAAPDLERFQRERQILASLDHPGIARLLDGGVADDGRLYAVIDHVDGESLVERCRQRGAGLHDRLALFLQVCEVVAYAHRNLVVHRDLKPGNILVTRDGRVKLLDFGVAKRLDGLRPEAADLTSAPYTSDYAAPEQLTGHRITTATDVYALGVILFELLTGERPWRSDGLPIARIVQQIVHAEPPLMSKVSASPPAPVATKRLAGDLDAIVATCLRKDAADRYATVEALQRDIEHHLHSEPVSARRRTRAYVTFRLLRRYRWAAGGAALLVAILAIGLVATLWQAQRAEVERDAANRAAAREAAVRNELTNLFRSSAEQKGDAPMTARAMLDLSAKRVLKEYREDPQLLGKVVMALVDLYGALSDLEGETALLESYLAHGAIGADPESVAAAQQEFAFVEVMRGNFGHAAELLPKAEATWASAPRQFQARHLESLRIRGMLLREQGDMEGSVRTFRQAIADRAAYSGRDSTEAIDLYNSLAITLQRDNRKDEALAAYRAAVDMDTRLGRSDAVEGLLLRGNMGVLASQVGHLHEAEQVLKAVSEKLRERTGESEAVAAYMSLYGDALTALGRPAEAIAVLRPATDMAFKFAGATNPIAIQSRLFLSSALTMSGQLAEARAQSAANIELARKQLGETATLTLETRAASARIDLAAGHAEAADAQFSALLESMHELGKRGEPMVANALLGKGEALLAQGKAADAVVPLREAVALRERFRWGDQNWELALARCRLGAALTRAKLPGGADLLRQGVAVLAAQVGEGDSRVVQARRSLAEST